MGAWIETLNFCLISSAKMSHPSWVRGLKRFHSATCKIAQRVAPLVGAWIETLEVTLKVKINIVAPLVGAWIETI